MEKVSFEKMLTYIGINMIIRLKDYLTELDSIFASSTCASSLAPTGARRFPVGNLSK